MKRLLSLFVILVGLQVSAQTSTSWIKSYAGKIGKTSFTMLLHKAGNDYDAYVYYTSTQLPYLISAQGQKTNTITLTGTPTGSDDSEKWRLTIVGNKISGSFILNDKITAVSAQENNLQKGAAYVYTEKKTNLNVADKKSPHASFYQSGIWYSNNSLINKILWPSYTTKTAGQHFIENKNTFFNNFKKDTKTLKPADYKDDSYMYSSESFSKLLMSYVSKNLVVFTEDNYEFNGGAHSNGVTIQKVIDLGHRKQLELKDIISDTSALTALLEKNYRRIYKVPADQSLMDYGLFTNQISSNENFFVTSKCLGFTYNHYEIAPYAGGQITISIPYNEFKHLVTDFAKDLFVE